MLTSRFAPRRAVGGRSGFTLFEMTVVLVLIGLVLGLISAIGTKLQRQLHETLAHVATAEELSSAAAILPLDVRSLSPLAGDIRAGEARDTSLEIRVTVASGVICALTPTTLVLAPLVLPGARRATPSLQAGDTAWVLADSDTGESWRSLSVRAVRPVTGGCARVVDTPGHSVFDVDRQLALDVRDSIPDTSGILARVTRPVRYDIYRAGDGLWYLGLRTWSSATAQFTGVQPLAGPYASPLANGGTHIEYFDNAGVALSSGAADTRGIARLEWVIRTLPHPGSPTTDSARVVVAVRNRR